MAAIFDIWRELVCALPQLLDENKGSHLDLYILQALLQRNGMGYRLRASISLRVASRVTHTQVEMVQSAIDLLCMVVQ